MAARARSGVSSSKFTAVLLCAVLLTGGVAAGCGSGGGSGGPEGTAAGGASNLATSAASPLEDSGASGELIDVTGEARPDAADRAEIERRLALPRFTYVGEVDSKADGKGAAEYRGALAIIDSETDKRAHRPWMGEHLESVAVAPDGRLVYAGDRELPVVHVVDAETYNEVRTVSLPGVHAPKKLHVTVAGKFCYADLTGCSSALACTPDGTRVLVLSKAGLQVIDTASFEVVRTLPELRDGYDLAISFDGRRAYIATSDSLKRGYHTITEWSKMSVAGKGGGLALLDLESWKVVKRVKCGQVGGIAVDPDDSRVFCSDYRLKALRIVDTETLADIAVVSLKSDKAQYFQPRGVGVLPDGSKVYVVCAAVTIDPTMAAAGVKTPDLFFCAVVSMETKEVVKRIPLDAY
jgi:sugar lactone lactonase YvrE